MSDIYIILKVSISKKDPDLLNKIAGRAYTMDGVEDVTARIVDVNSYEFSDEAVKKWEKWLDPNHIRLHAGEMTAQELRTVQAVVAAMLKEMK